MFLRCLFLVLLTGCASENTKPVDKSLPRIVEVIPQQFVIPIEGILEIRFSRPLWEASITPKNIQLTQAESKKSVPITLQLLDGGGKIRVTPTETLKERTHYIVTLSSSVRDAVGRPLGDGRGQKTDLQVHFQTGDIVISESAIPADEKIELEHIGLPQVISLETETTIQSYWNKYHVHERMWYGRVDGPLNCLGQPCPVAPINHKMHATGLVANESYRYAIRAEDNEGNVIHLEGKWQNERMPKIAINEIMPGDAETTFIEFANYDTQPVDIQNFSLSVRLANGSWKNCLLSSSSGNWILAPGTFALLTGQKFSEDFYRLNQPDIIHRMKTIYVCGQLATEGQRIVLKDDKNRIVSSYGGYLVVKNGMSIERISPDATDEANHFGLSHPQLRPTPGKTNNYGKIP